MDWSSFAAGLPGPDPDPEVWSDDPIDELIARRVAGRFLRDPEIRSGHILVAVQNRVVILKAGSTPTAPAWRRAGRPGEPPGSTTSATGC